MDFAAQPRYVQLDPSLTDDDLLARGVKRDQLPLYHRLQKYGARVVDEERDAGTVGDEADRLLREARNLDGSRRFYPPGLHLATHRYREHWTRLSLLPESPERDEAMQHIERELAKFEKGEDEAKRQYLRAHGIET